MEQSNLRIKPRVLPRDFIDVLIGFFVVLPILGTLMFFLPSGLVWWLSGSVHLGFPTLLIISAVWGCCTVWSLEVSPEGIRFVRLCGAPKFLRWDEITDISEASRRDVVLHGWLWPMFPPREMSPTLSALGHFRIRWDSGVAYFPPAHPDEFRK